MVLPSISDRQSVQQDAAEALRASLESLRSIPVTAKNKDYLSLFASTTQSVEYICGRLIDRRGDNVHQSIRLTRDNAIGLIDQIERDAPADVKNEVMRDLYDWLARLSRTFRIMCDLAMQQQSQPAPTTPSTPA